MKVLELIDEVHRRVPEAAPFGTRCKVTATVTTAQGRHAVAVAARIDAHGRRWEQYWCDDVRVERSILLRLTCAESECPHAIQVRMQWIAFHSRGPAKTPRVQLWPRPLVEESEVVVGRQRFVARPARFPCFTPCPHDAHPPLMIEKKGFDLFEEGACLGGGVVEIGGVKRPRIPTVRAAEAYVLARHLESLAALGVARETSRPDQGPNQQAG